MESKGTPRMTRDQLLGASMIVAPLLLLISTIVSVTGRGLIYDQTGGIIQVYAMQPSFPLSWA